MSKIGNGVRGRINNSFALLVVVVTLLLLGTAVAAPTIVLSKKVGPPTSKILVSGKGFRPNVGVDIYFDTKDEALVVTDGKGEFHKAAIHAPRSAHPGKHWVTALDRNIKNGAQKAFVVYTDWLQFNFTPDHEGLNPYENVLSPSNVGNLELRWKYESPFFNWVTSPSGADGVLYAASYAGDVYALNAHTGALLWKNPSPVGGSSYPAVGDELVYVGAGSNLNALNSRTGALVWKYSTDNDDCCFSSPTVVDGIIYAVLDFVYALDARTGSLLWKYARSGTSQAVANGAVYVGQASLVDNVFALDNCTGGLLWSATVDSYVYASPTVSNGMVYVGTDSGDMFALDAGTGEFRWRYSTGSVRSPSAAAVADGLVYFNSSDNNAYALDAKTGSLVWYYPVGVNSLPNPGPTIANGVAYFLLGNDLVALEAKTGVVLLQLFLPDSFFYPVAVADGFAYFGSVSGYVYAFGLPGAGSWKESPRNPPEISTLAPDLALPPSSLNRDGSPLRESRRR